MPLWARSLAGNAETFVPANAIVPCASGKRPMMAFMSVVLPTPLRPTMATISPGCDGEADVAHDHRAPIARRDL